MATEEIDDFGLIRPGYVLPSEYSSPACRGALMMS
jgi:hypothetical protein